jgi:hypothetical protein
VLARELRAAIDEAAAAEERAAGTGAERRQAM